MATRCRGSPGTREGVGLVLEKARREAKEMALRAEAARDETERQRKRAELDRAQAEEAHQKARMQAGGATQEAELLRAEGVMAARREAEERETNRRHQGPPNESLEKLEIARKQVMTEFEERQKALQTQHQRLESEQKELEADMKRKLVHLDELQVRISRNPRRTGRIGGRSSPAAEQINSIRFWNVWNAWRIGSTDWRRADDRQSSPSRTGSNSNRGCRRGRVLEGKLMRSCRDFVANRSEPPNPAHPFRREQRWRVRESGRRVA